MKKFEYRGMEYYQDGTVFKIWIEGKVHTYLSSHTVRLLIDKHLDK